MNPNRPKHNSLLLISFTAIFLLSAAALAIHLRAVFDLSRNGFIEFVDSSLRYLCAIGFIFFIWSFRSEKVKDGQSDRHSGYWAAGFLSLFTITTLLIVVVDPYSKFGYRSFLRLSPVQTEKIRAYKNLSEVPEIVVLGSSRALTISPEYINSTLHLSAFNWAVEGGSTESFLILTRFMLAEGDLPAVLFVEISPPMERGEGAVAERSPLEMLQYMPPEVAFMTLKQDWYSVLRLQAVADSIFLVAREILLGRPEDGYVLTADGGMLNLGVSGNDTFLQQDLEIIDIPHCSTLDQTGLQNINEFIRIVSKNNSAVVFYQSPRHPMLSQKMMLDSEYATCQNALEKEMELLVQQYPNVQFLNYFQLESVTSLGLDGFYDSHHITYLGAERLMDAAADSLQQAQAWANSRRVAH